MTICFVMGCSCSSKKKNEKISLHCFPKRRELIGIWLRYCGIPEQDITWRTDDVLADSNSNKYRMCSRHFSEDQFHTTSKQGKHFKCGRLMAGATPNVPCPGPSTSITATVVSTTTANKDSEAQTTSCCMCLCSTATQTRVDSADKACQTDIAENDKSGSRDAFGQWPEYELNFYGDWCKVAKDHTYGTRRTAPSPPPVVAPLYASTPVKGPLKQLMIQLQASQAQSTEDSTYSADEDQPHAPQDLPNDAMDIDIEETVEEVSETVNESSDSDSDFVEYSIPADDSWTEGGLDELEQMVLEKKYLCFVTKILELFERMVCHYILPDQSKCGRPLVNTEIGESGSCLKVRARCFENHPPFEWSSQPDVKRVSAGNLLICSSILFSGLTFEKASTFAGFLGMEFVCSSTFYDYQKMYLFPTIHEAWSHQQMELEMQFGDSEIAIAGDGQCDSPGYSAKYCVYTVMEQNTRKILSIEVVQVTECTSSTGMEKVALQRSLDKLIARGFKIKILTTDRHISIAKVMRELYKFINHQFDVWHYGKSLKKKVVEASKKKDCKDLGGWLQSITNHLWWSSRTCGKSLCMLNEKWNSILLHTTNKHQWIGYEVFHQCDHEPLSPDTARKKKWLIPETPSHDALVRIVCDKTFKKDLRGLTEFTHTGPLEVFHSNVLRFRAKLYHYGIDGMLARTLLAALLHNANTGRKQARTKVGEDQDPMKGAPRYKIECPKSKKDWIRKVIFEKMDYGHVYNMLVYVLQMKKFDLPTTWQSRAGEMPKNIAPVPAPDKVDVISRMTTRF